MSDAELEITPQQAFEAAQAGRALIVDVRTAAEWDAGRIPGAVHIALDQLSSRAGELAPDRELVFSCKAGGRSLMAAQAFAASGRPARSLAGGAHAWQDTGLPFEGVVADH